MKRKLLLLNAALVGALILSAAELKVRYEQARGRDRIFSALAEPKQAPQAAPPPAPRRLRQGDYLPIVRRHLLTKDRNATIEVIVESEAPPVQPPLPVLGGLVNFGDGPMALMAANGDAPKWVGVGEEIGDWVLEGVEDEVFSLSWSEGTVEIDQSKLAGAVERPPTAKARGARAAAPPGSSGEASASLSAEKPKGVGGKFNIGAEIRPGVHRADPKDDSPEGTESDGFVKVVRRSPFGTTAWWKKK